MMPAMVPWPMDNKFFVLGDTVCRAVSIVTINGNSWVALEHVEDETSEFSDADAIFENCVFYRTADDAARELVDLEAAREGV